MSRLRHLRRGQRLLKTAPHASNTRDTRGHVEGPATHPWCIFRAINFDTREVLVGADLISAVDALLNQRPALPPHPARGALRRAGGLTQQQVADALGVKRLAVARWESGESEPRAPHREAYAHLLKRLAVAHPTIGLQGKEASDTAT
ncbi:helix-turn-helix transcriptional regulator [Streptomyces fuscigenes]|uniref:helix-turn-helix transcriptional regulator n=1 Tax=Streptomyces fuscigenes TaxID=1528880 RepID=UPI001F4196CD|nr:helix-turn-helix transcriptional regulator [Streptomyces fuscigenes]MCF3960483.1 helix-turn-helix domain-containing protein [Streptomyces fuscigenes]